MQMFTVWPVLVLMAGVVVCVPTVPGSGNRSLLYWVVLPPLLAGALALCSRLVVS